MSAQSTILREYLFSLGFKVNPVEVKKFDGMLDGVDKKALKVGAALLGVATAAQVMVERFSSQMEKLYYASKRADSTVSSIQALQYGAKQIGLSGDQILSAMEGMARAMRANPGLQALVESLGVKVEGRDKADVLTDLVAQLRRMPFYVAQQYASMFGIDPDTLLMLEQGLEKMREAAAERKRLAEAAGVDSDKAAEAAVRYQNALRGVYERLGLLKDALSIQLLPAFESFTAALTKQIDKLTAWISNWDKVKAQISEGKDAIGALLSGDWKGFFQHMAKQKELAEASVRPKGAAAGIDFGYGSGWGGSSNDPGSDNAAAMFARLEKAYGLPPGLLDAMWKKESGRGANMLSPKGAEGHFQFLPGTAKDAGVSNPYNLGDAANGAARYMANLLGRYGGNLESALAAYNWGMGNVDKRGLGAMPSETRAYVRDIQRAVTLNQKTDIHVSGGGTDTAKAVAREQRTVNADLVRNFQGAVN